MRSCFLTLVLLAFAVPASAQVHIVSTAFGPSETVVRFTLEGAILPSDDMFETLQLPLLERLAGQKNLASLEIGGQPNTVYHIEFGFTTLDAFRSWYAAEETKLLMQELRSASRRPPVTGLTVQRQAMVARMGLLAQDGVSPDRN